MMSVCTVQDIKANIMRAMELTYKWNVALGKPAIYKIVLEENQTDFTEKKVTSIQTSNNYNEEYARHYKNIFGKCY